jgi:hypothetical protein
VFKACLAIREWACEFIHSELIDLGFQVGLKTCAAVLMVARKIEEMSSNLLASLAKTDCATLIGIDRVFFKRVEVDFQCFLYVESVSLPDRLKALICILNSIRSLSCTALLRLYRLSNVSGFKQHSRSSDVLYRCIDCRKIVDFIELKGKLV